MSFLKRKYKRECILAISDTHGGYELGLANPKTMLKTRKEELKPYILNEVQEYLYYDVLEWGLGIAKKIIDSDPTHVIHVGDITHGNKYIDEQISTKISPQFIMAADNFNPILSLPNVVSLRLDVGTASHGFGQSTAEDIIEVILRERYPKIDIRSLYHGLTSIAGIKIDHAHHGPGVGIRNWTKGNVARLYLKSLMQDDISEGKVPPDLVLRGHYHEIVKQWNREKMNGRWYEGWLMVMPSMAFPGAYANQVVKSPPYVTNGIIVVEVINGRIYEIHEMTKTFDIRTYEEISG